MGAVLEATDGAPGLLDFRTCRSTDGGYLAGVSRWESKAAFTAALPRIGSLRHRRRPEWTSRPDELLTLTDA